MKWTKLQSESMNIPQLIESDSDETEDELEFIRKTLT